MPITSPAALSSGPPELPGLIGASVCRTLSIVKPLGAVIVALQGGDHAGRERPFEIERVADRQHRIAHLRRARVAERERMQRQSVGRDAQHREIVGRDPADHLGFDVLAFFEAHRHLDRVLDHVVVGEDRAVPVDHDARAGVLALLRFAAFAAEQVERRWIRLLHDGRGHERDARGGRARRSRAASVPCSSARRSKARSGRRTGPW